MEMIPLPANCEDKFAVINFHSAPRRPLPLPSASSQTVFHVVQQLETFCSFIAVVELGESQNIHSPCFLKKSPDKQRLELTGALDSRSCTEENFPPKHYGK
jgi:hypothetical protein